MGVVGRAAGKCVAWCLLGAQAFGAGTASSRVPCALYPSSPRTKACSSGSDLHSWRAVPCSLAGYRGPVGPERRTGLLGAVGSPPPSALHGLPKSGPPYLQRLSQVTMCLLRGQGSQTMCRLHLFIQSLTYGQKPW